MNCNTSDLLLLDSLMHNVLCVKMQMAASVFETATCDSWVMWCVLLYSEVFLDCLNLGFGFSDCFVIVGC